MTYRYEEIARTLMDRREGLVKPMRLPDEHGMAMEFSVGRDTIRRALKLLEDRGAVVRRRGAGTLLQPVVQRQGDLRGKAVGFVPPWWDESPNAWYTSVVFDGVSRWAEEHDCLLSVMHTERKPRDIDTWLEEVHRRQLAGLIWVHPQARQMPLVERSAKIFPTIVLGRSYPGRGLHHVSPDYAQAAQLIDQHLADLGHQEYAIVGRSALEDFTRNWINAFAGAWSAAGRDFDYRTHFVDFHTFPTERLDELILDYYVPYTQTDIQAYALTMSSYLQPLMASDRFRALAEQDLSIIAFDFGVQSIDTYWPGRTFTHVTCDWSRMAHRAMDALAALVAGETLPEIMTEPVRLVEGESSRPYQRDRSAIPAGT